MKQLNLDSDPSLNVGFSEATIEEFRKITEQRGISQSELIRQWVRIGYRSEQELIPQFKDEKERTTNSEKLGPVETLFEQELPDQENEAVTIDELQNQIAERVNNRVLELFRESEIVNVSNGRLYKDA